MAPYIIKLINRVKRSNPLLLTKRTTKVITIKVLISMAGTQVDEDNYYKDVIPDILLSASGKSLQLWVIL